MFDIIKTTISAGGYKLADIMYKIKKLYILGDLNEAQMDELLAMASGGVSTDAERPEVLEMLHSLDERIKALESKLTGDNGNTEAPEAYEEWKPWDGISNKYQHGAIVSYNGELWESVYNGQNVWQPGAPGTEALWEKHV